MRSMSAAAAAAAIVLGLLPGCVGKYKSDFKVIVINKAVNAIEVLADGGALGVVTAGQSATFTVKLTESNANQFTNGVAPTPQSQVTFTARDVRTNILSRTKPTTLAGGAPTYLTFEAADFPVTTPTVARFTFSPTSPGLRDDVQFSGATSTVSGAGTYQWDFGDGRTATGITTSYRFSREGTFNVSLTVTSDNGQSSTASRAVTVTSVLPGAAANFTFSPAAPAVNQNIYFNASTSAISNGTFAWDFGDGNTQTGVSVVHKYARAGNYTVTLRVTNQSGQSAVASRGVTASNTSPTVVANFAFSPTNPGINQTIYFNASASQPQTGTFRWDFGDGESGTGITPIHSYDYGGAYAVTLTVTNDVGQSASVTRTITVQTSNAGVTASFVFSPTAPAPNQEVFFDASASRPVDATFAWNFGDGSPPESGMTPSHRYAVPATYTVTLTVSNALGQVATTSRTVTVTGTSPGVFASFTFSPVNPGINQEVFFNASASRPADGSFAWSWGDGTSQGSGVTPSHRYTLAGTYTVVLTVTNSVGQSSTTTRTVTVTTSSSNVTASFTVSPTSAAVNMVVNFDASASRPVDATFTWNFGDGDAGAGVMTTHAFRAAGNYTVTLNVRNSTGQTATTTRTIAVTNASPGVTSSFTISPLEPSVGQSVFLNASASVPSSGTFVWNFGDGTTGNGITPTKVYTASGTYTITLTVTNASGQSATSSRTITVAAVPFEADFTFSPTNPSIAGGTNTVQFDATPSSAGVTSWAWDWGDGTAAGAGQKTSHTFTRAGAWVVRLTVSDGAGRTATLTRTVTVVP